MPRHRTLFSKSPPIMNDWRNALSYVCKDTQFHPTSLPTDAAYIGKRTCAMQTVMSAGPLATSCLSALSG